MKDLPGFFFAAAVRYLIVLLPLLALIRVFMGPASSLHEHAAPAALGVFVLVTAWAYFTTIKRYRERLAAPPAVLDPRTVRLHRR